MKPTIIVPTYNEVGNARAMTEALLALKLPDIDVLTFDQLAVWRIWWRRRYLQPSDR